MSEEVFEIIIIPPGSGQRYRVRVQVLFRSAQLMRFRIAGGKKEMIMEKFLFRKQDSWKLGTLNFTMKGNSRDIAMIILQIQEAIDRYLKTKKIM